MRIFNGQAATSRAAIRFVYRYHTTVIAAGCGLVAELQRIATQVGYSGQQMAIAVGIAAAVAVCVCNGRQIRTRIAISSVIQRTAAATCIADIAQQICG